MRVFVRNKQPPPDFEWGPWFLLKKGLVVASGHFWCYNGHITYLLEVTTAVTPSQVGRAFSVVTQKKLRPRFRCNSTLGFSSSFHEKNVWFDEIRRLEKSSRSWECIPAERRFCSSIGEEISARSWECRCSPLGPRNASWEYLSARSGETKIVRRWKQSKLACWQNRGDLRMYFGDWENGHIFHTSNLLY